MTNTNKYDDGGFAFPQPISDSPSGAILFPNEYGYGGMSLRDYFAGQALNGFMVKQGWIGYFPESAGDEGKHRAFLLSTFAKDSYAIADAMLAERPKPQETKQP